MFYPFYKLNGRPLQNAAFALIGSFSTPRRLAAASKAKRSGIIRVLKAFKSLAATAGYLRKINKFALQAPFFKGLNVCRKSSF